MAVIVSFLAFIEIGAEQRIIKYIILRKRILQDMD